MFTPTSATDVTVDNSSLKGGAQEHKRSISADGQKNRAYLKKDAINLASENSIASSQGRTSGGGFAFTSLFTQSKPVAVIFPEIQILSPEVTEFPDVTGTQAVYLEHTPSTSTPRQGAPVRRYEKASLSPISQNTAHIEPLQTGQSASLSGLYREAEHPDEIEGGFVIGQDAEAFGSRYLVLPKGILTKNAIASYRFTVTEDQAGEYYLWGRVLAKNGSDSFRVSIDSEKAQYIWDTGIFQQWAWTVFVARKGKRPYIRNQNPQKIHLTMGEHTLSIWHRERDAQLDALLLSRPVKTKAGEITHVLPRQPPTEGWVSSEEWQSIYLNTSPQVFTSYIRFGKINPTLINWPLQRLRFSGQPLELALRASYRTYLLSNHRPPKRSFSFYHIRFGKNSTIPRLSLGSIFCFSFGSRSEIFVVASPVAFLSDESGLLAVQGTVGALGEGFTFSEQQHLRQVLLYGNGQLILLASPQGSPRLRREVEKIFRGCEWQPLSPSHPLLSHPAELLENVSIEGMQLQSNRGHHDKIRRKWQVLLVEISESKILPQFLWNLSHFKEGKRGN